MTIRISHLLLSLCMFLPFGAGAQTLAARHSVEAAWGVSVPLGTSFLDKTGAGAFSLRYEYRFASRFAAGMLVGLDRTVEKGLFDGTFDGDAVTGYTERIQQQIPILASLCWYMLGEKQSVLRPYVGIGIGVQWTRFEITGETINSSRADSWGLGTTVGIGTRIYPRREGAFFLDVRAAYRYGSNKWNAAGVNGLQGFYPSIGAGINF